MPFALEPSDRKVLHERIAHRFDAMLSAKSGAHHRALLRLCHAQDGHGKA